MTIDLKPEQQRAIDLAVRSGAYQNPGEVLDQAFAIIREQLDLEDWMLEQRESNAAHIEKGFAQAETPATEIAGATKDENAGGYFLQIKHPQ
jgi:Arc/MetJ-type ribon-helix-helix transcriptional regulator